MTGPFCSSIAGELRGFVQLKRNLGYRYVRSELMLLEFDRFLCAYSRGRPGWRLDRAILVWLSSKPQRKVVSVAAEASVLRQFCLYLRRIPGHVRLREPLWPRLPNKSKFVPYLLSTSNVLQLLKLAAQLKRPRFRASLYRALILLLYCTGLRFGEALRLCLHDVDTASNVLFVERFKGRARWVPFHRSLAQELDKYLVARRAYASAEPGDRFLVGLNKRTLPVITASINIRALFRKAGLKPEKGRIGPRPYDLRHSFAVDRLTRWYRQGVDLHSRLPWLSAYMGHDDILGTETYLTATPELLRIACNRFRSRFVSRLPDEDIVS